MNIDQRIKDLEEESVWLKERAEVIATGLLALKAEVAKPAEEELKPGETVIVWDAIEPLMPMFRKYLRSDARSFLCESGYIGKEPTAWDRARRPTLSDWLKLGAPVLDINRLFRENPDAKVITQDENGRTDVWRSSPFHDNEENCWDGSNVRRLDKPYPDWRTRIWHRPEGI